MKRKVYFEKYRKVKGGNDLSAWWISVSIVPRWEIGMVEPPKYVVWGLKRLIQVLDIWTDTNYKN